MGKDNKMTKREWYVLIMTGICIAVTLCITLLHDYSEGVENSPEEIYDERLLSFNEGWYSRNGEEITLPVMMEAKENEEVCVFRTLPDSITAGTYIRFRSEAAFVKVYINEELIYSSTEVSTGGKSIPLNQWNYASLQPEYSGKEIKISFKSPYSYYSGILPEIILGAHADVLLYTFSGSGLIPYLSICIIAMGLIMILLSLINTVGDFSLRSYVYMGLFLILIGIMLISQGNLMRTNAGNYYKDYILFHACLRLCALVYCIYVYAREGEKLNKTFLILTAANVLNFIGSLMLHFSGLADFTRTIPAALILTGIPLIIDFWFSVLRHNSGSLRFRIAAGTGLFLLIVSICIEIFLKLSYLQNEYKYILMMGALAFAICQSISVIIFSYDIAARQIAISKELDDKRIKLMMSQIQPHFIYNTLNTIRSMTKLEPDKAYDMIYHFSNYLKFNINTLGGRDIISFSEELNHIKAYTAIECERFHRLKVEYNIDSEEFYVPPLTIQPFVENAIKHGICKKEGGGTVIIKSKETKKGIEICIADNGIGFDPENSGADSNRTGIGIKNASYRLRELMDAKIQICSAPGYGCSIKIIIPKILS